MKKYIWISLLFFVSCGSRKVATEKQSEKTDLKTETSAEAKTESETKTETSIDLSKYLENQSISVIADGNPFTVNYNGFSYSGSAPIEIRNKKEQTKTKYFENTETTYKTFTRYKTQTTYKTQYIYKSKDSERKAYPWYWIVIGSILLWELLKFVAKKYLPLNKLKLWKQ